MTFPEFARLEGALICIALAVLLLAIGRVVYELLRESPKSRIQRTARTTTASRIKQR